MGLELTTLKDSPIRAGWFVSNLVTVVNSLLYIFSWKYKGALKAVWYRSTLLGALATFSIVVYQNVASYKTATGSINYRAFLSDDNVHYLYDALIWLVLPAHLLAIIPFLSFSFFHVLNFASTDLLPAVGVGSLVSSKIQHFTKQYHELSRREAAGSELLLLLQLVFEALFFRKWSWISLLAYAVFIKVKSEGSLFTRNALKSWEVRIDGVVSNEKVPPALKAQWGNFKRAFKTLDRLSLIRTVEKKTEEKTR